MKLIELVQPTTPPEPRGARIITFGPPVKEDTEDRRKARERWREMAAVWNARRKERGWK